MVSSLDIKFSPLENPGNFLLAGTEVVMTTVIPSHVKDKNGIFTGYLTFLLEKSWYLTGVYIAN